MHLALSLVSALLAILLLVDQLEASVLQVSLKHPKPEQKQILDKWRRSVHQMGFQRHDAKNPKLAGRLAALRSQGNDESTEIDDLDVTTDPYYYRHWLNPQGEIKLGIPAQDFIVAFSTRSPDTFVAHSGSVNWENFLTFDETKSYTYSSEGKTFQDSLFVNSSMFSCETHNSGVIGKDLLTLGDIILPVKFGLVDNVTVAKCMDWQDSDIEGMLGLSLAKSVNGIPSTLEQIAPILDEPVFAVLTTTNKDNKRELEYHMKIGSSHIPGHCLAEDYVYFPSTSGNIHPSKMDGYHAQLHSVELRYANGSFARWNMPAQVDMEFSKLVTDDPYYRIPYIYGDINTVDQVNKQLGGEDDWWYEYAPFVPCNTTNQPDMVFKFGNQTHKAEWVVRPEEYTLPYYDSYCVSLLQYHPWFGAWTSLEYHNNLCFAVSFGADEGNQIGLARPKSAEQKKQK